MMLRIDPFALLTLCVLGGLLFWYGRKKEWTKPAVTFLFSSSALLKERLATWRERFASIPTLLYFAGLASLLLAFIDPHYLTEDTMAKGMPREGLAIFLVLDRSGSMGRVVDHEWRSGKWYEVTQFDLLKKFTSQFINKTPSDLIGIVTFARSAQVIAPLTLDHNALQENLAKLSVVRDQTQDGTAIGYAIYKTAHLITALKAEENGPESPPYQIKGAAMIVITDGLQDPSLLDRGNRLRTMDLETAGTYARENNIHLYIVHVGTLLNEARFAPNKRELEELAKNSGGQLIVASSFDKLDELLKNIHKLERSRIYGETPPSLRKIALFPYLLLIGLACLGMSIFLNTIVWRKVV